MKNKPFEGEVKISQQSSLRKLMRAANRGMIDGERLFIIQTAMRSAEKRRQNASAEKRAT